MIQVHFDSSFNTSFNKVVYHFSFTFIHNVVYTGCKHEQALYLIHTPRLIGFLFPFEMNNLIVGWVFRF